MSLRYLFYLMDFKNFLLFALLVFSYPVITNGQETFHNFGNVQVHHNGTIGFYSNMVNDGDFSERKGLVGFYNDAQSAISGAYSPSFYDFEVAVENNLVLDIPITVANSLNFIYGNIITARNNKSVYVQFLKKASYDGAVDLSKVDGQVAMEGQNEFTFPVGNVAKLRPITIKFMDGSFFAKCQYYNEDPKNPVSFYESFDTSKKHVGIGEINSKEFWVLSSTGIIQLTLSWDSESDLSSKISNIENVIVVGWSKEKEQWENLGNSFYDGDPNEGIISSNPFNANNYSVFTVGTSFELSDNLTENYLITPDADGVNDNLIIEITRQSPNNKLMIFNRKGQLVYELSNYQDEFKGLANKGNGNNLLSKGTYFYLLELHDLNTKHQGYFYIHR